MAELTSKANIGDIISSEKFAYGILDYSKNGDGHYVADRSKICVDGINQGYKVVYRDPRDPANLANRLVIDVTAHDESRGKALFIVEKAEMRDTRQRDGSLASLCYVEARRLNENKHETDELICFYLGEGPFRNCIPEVELVGKMETILSQKG